jgi:hypothetical protein
MHKSHRSLRVLLGAAAAVVASVAVGTAGADSHTPPAPNTAPAPKTAPDQKSSEDSKGSQGSQDQKGSQGSQDQKGSQDSKGSPDTKTAPDPKSAPNPATTKSASDPKAAPPAPLAPTVTAAPTAPSAASQLVDTSRQMADIQKRIARLQAKGQLAKTGVLTASAAATGGCGFQNPSQVFAPWGDLASYALAPQGNLASTTNWSFTKTTVAAEHDPFTAGSNSLKLAEGSEAVSPAMCVDLSNPTIRLFLKDTGGNGKSALKVNVIYEDLNGNIQHLTLAKLRVGSSWAPSITIPIAVNILSTANASGLTAVAFDFKAEGLQKNETLSLDGLYVDPYMSR